SYFDPNTQQYTTLSSEEIVLNVENGPLTAGGTTPSEGNNGKKPVVLSKEQFKYIQLSANLQPMNETPYFKSLLFWLLLGGPLLLIPIFILIGKRRSARLQDVEGNRLRKADRLAKKYLAEAKKHMQDKAVFYEAMERALHNYLKAKLNIETAEMSKDRIAQLLEERNVSETTISSFRELLKSCEFARYTPASSGTIQQDYNKAVETLSEIDKQIQ
ncbi:MAG: protein BatD, partial [Altibacter sp.]|nr:protein BatD [Altibacter sp.]